MSAKPRQLSELSGGQALRERVLAESDGTDGDGLEAVERKLEERDGADAYDDLDGGGTDPEQEIITTDVDPLWMTEERRVGSNMVTIGDDDAPTPFGKPSSLAANQFNAAMQEFQGAGQDDTRFNEWLWLTCAEWCLADEKDARHFATNYSTIELIMALRSLKLGGNGRRR